MSRSSTSSEFSPKDGFEIAFKHFPESQMAQLYAQRSDGRFCDAVITCTDGEIKAHRCILATLCARDFSKPVTVPVKTEAVRRLANLCYTGYLKVNVENLEQDIKVAKALECEFLLNAVQKWVTENVKQVMMTEKILQDLDADTVRGCLGRIKYMNENWQDFLVQWAGSNPQRKKDLASLRKKVEKLAFVSIYRFVVVGGKAMKYDGTIVVDENWPIVQNDRIIIVDSKKKKRVNIARDGTISLYVGDKLKMTHSHKAIGIHESVRPIILWLNDGSLLKVVDKADPFEDLGNEEKIYTKRISTGYQAWNAIPCSDVHYAFSDGRRLLLVSRDVHTYTIVSGDTFQTLSHMIRGGPRQSPFVVPSLCQGDSIVVAIIDLERSPKTFYFVQYEGGRSRVLSESFEASPEAQFSVM